MTVDGDLYIEKDKRYCFRSDNDGHTYLIAYEDVEAFDRMLMRAEDSGNHADFIEAFDKRRINGGPSNYSFTNPQDLP